MPAVRVGGTPWDPFHESPVRATGVRSWAIVPAGDIQAVAQPDRPKNDALPFVDRDHMPVVCEWGHTYEAGAQQVRSGAVCPTCSTEKAERARAAQALRSKRSPCSSCGRPYALTQEGTVRYHASETKWKACPGSWCPPRPTFLADEQQAVAS